VVESWEREARLVCPKCGRRRKFGSRYRISEVFFSPLLQSTPRLFMEIGAPYRKIPKDLVLQGLVLPNEPNHLWSGNSHDSPSIASSAESGSSGAELPVNAGAYRPGLGNW
jgi:hypothetical protein